MRQRRRRTTMARRPEPELFDALVSAPPEAPEPPAPPEPPGTPASEGAPTAGEMCTGADAPSSLPDPLAADEDSKSEPDLDPDLVPVGVEPRPYQLRVIRGALDILDQYSSVMIESPTGSGKTVMGLALARQLQQAHGMRVGWCAMRRNLLKQAQAQNESGGFGVDMRLISMFDKTPPQVDLLVVDEAQHDAALSMANLHGVIQPRKVIGLSATPYRADRLKLCFEKVIRDAGIHELIQAGYLSKYHHFTIPQYNPVNVAETFLREPERWGQSLIFFHRLEQCRACQDTLAAGGVQAEVVTASSPREKLIDAFAAGELKVLINMMILSEGFDCPSLKTVFCRPSGRGCTVQMAGRVFRRCPELAFKQVVQCEATRHPMPRTATPEEQYLWTDNAWRAVKANRQIAEICKHMRRLIARTQVKLPDFVKQHRSSDPFRFTRSPSA